MTQQMTNNASQSAGNGSANANPAPSAAEPLEALVQQFQNSTASPAKQVADFVSTVRPVLEYVEGKRQSEEAEAVNAKVAESVKALKAYAELPDEFPDDFAEGHLRNASVKKAAVNRAWAEVAENPEAWDMALKAEALELKERAKGWRDGSNPRKDIEAASAAVRNSTHSAPPPAPVDYAAAIHSSDQEYEKIKRQIIAAQRTAAK